jgi:hypothetical protein
MTEYQFQWWPSGTKPALTPSVRLQAESQLHGAALALRHFKQVGCDISAPLAHIPTTSLSSTDRRSRSADGHVLISPS